MTITPEELSMLSREELQKIYMEQYDKLFALGTKMKEAFEREFKDQKFNLVADADYSTLYLSGPWFIFSFIDVKTNDDDKMTLLFDVAATAKAAAAATKIVAMHLRPDAWKFGKDYFYDKKTATVKYDDEARTRRLEVHYESQGLKKCPCCERFFEPEVINKDGICMLCEEEIANTAWH